MVAAKKHVFIIGSKGIPAKYGGFETFVDQLTAGKQAPNIQYHIACLTDRDGSEFLYNDARCFNIQAPNFGGFRAVYYDLKSLKAVEEYIKKNQIKESIIYILACRIGPFFKSLSRRLKQLGATIILNPDGHEWKREKWSKPVRLYWKISERLMVKHVDTLICDSIGIESYIQDEYKKYRPSTRYISYGAHVIPSTIKDNDESINEWHSKNQIEANNYYLIVGRFVPENNYEFILKEFMKSKSQKKLVIISHVGGKFLESLRKKTNFDKDNRIVFAGTVYDQQLLKKIREKAFAYLHGHEVGGTNPSLLEALASTKLNLLLNVVFNREVAENAAVYFEKKIGSLSELIGQVERMDEETIENYNHLSTRRIEEYYSWKKIIESYEHYFNDLVPDAGVVESISHPKGIIMER